MPTGEVKFYDKVKGYGFIVDDATGKEVFVHKTGLTVEDLKQRDKVAFETIDGKKGLNAIQVKLL